MPVHINIGSEGLKAVKTSKYIFHFLDRESEKFGQIITLMRKVVKQRVLVFCNRRRTVDEIVAVLRAEGIVAHKLHGQMETSDRQTVMSDFRNGNAEVLVTTDVLSRGIDVPNIELVLVYDFPVDFETFVHRSGRTARAGAVGYCVVFVTPCEVPRIREKMQLFLGKIPGQRVPEQFRGDGAPRRLAIQLT